MSSFRPHQSAADDEYTKRENNYAYRRYWFNPRSLHKVRDIDLSSTILGGRIKTSLPVYISPAAMAKLGHPDGELNLVRAASTGGIMHGISINASCSLEEMDEVYKEGDPRIFQIYLDVNRKNSEELVKKVEKMGFEGIMFTVGECPTSVPCFHARGSRLIVDVYVSCSVRQIRSLPETESSTSAPSRSSRRLVRPASPPGQATRTPTSAGTTSRGSRRVLLFTSRLLQAISRADFRLTTLLMQSLTKLPIIVKGIQNVEDVALAAKYGADAVILSNHGGRSECSFCPPGLSLPHVLTKRPPVFAHLPSARLVSCFPCCLVLPTDRN